MKKFIIGLISGVMLASTIAFAATYTASPATFKVLVNGKEFVSDPPALVVEGRTYLPLRAMGDALGVPVEWNAELGQAEVGVISPVNDSVSGYKTYSGSKDIIDFGAFSGLNLSMETQERDEGIAYIYSFNEWPDEIDEYIDLMKENGYTFYKDEETLWNTTFYVINENSEKEPFVVMMGMYPPGTEDPGTEDFYFLVALYK